jgi:hypothetical protein
MDETMPQLCGDCGVCNAIVTAVWEGCDNPVAARHLASAMTVVAIPGGRPSGARREGVTGLGQ